ncbi:hypothetical protein GCM10011497_37190 [Elstera cyanobacteriorum]|nr:hypothetical protein GCM10011497_37190 [Elstera cyanobacteriorum]
MAYISNREWVHGYISSKTGEVTSVKLDVNSEQFQGVKQAVEAIDDDE